MSETKNATWVRYRHKQMIDIEYDVEVSEDGNPLTRPLNGEPCHLVRTIRNLSFHEEAHQPAFTYMPAQEFMTIYERAT